MVVFHRFDATKSGFPPSRVPVLPRLRWRSLTREMSTQMPGEVCYSRGRYALANSLRLCGVGKNGGLLAPAYHCRTMIDPALALGAPVVLYPIQTDLMPEMAGLQVALAASARPVRALLATHYFGVPKQFDALLAFCNAHNIALIEDCSHALVPADRTASRMGQLGRYGIASSYKFYPAPDGGQLWANGGAAMPDVPRRRAWKSELGALRTLVSEGFARRRDPLGPLESDIAAAARHTCPSPRDWLETGEGVSTHYAATDENLSSLATSRFIRSRTDRTRLALRRRAHYGQWLAAISDLPGCTALFENLPADCVPYMFPLLIDHPDPDFLILKRLGMPIWRWDEMAASDCPVAASYRTRLLHLPCHQELSAEQMDWMTAAVRAVMLRPRQPAAR